MGSQTKKILFICIILFIMSQNIDVLIIMLYFAGLQGVRGLFLFFFFFLEKKKIHVEYEMNTRNRY